MDAHLSPAPRLLFVDGHRKSDFFGALIDALEKELRAQCKPVSPPELFDERLDADLVVVNDESWSFCGGGIPDLRRRRIPVLHLADGILEWRNAWENPSRSAEAGGMPLFQPVLADKIACLGAAQARVLEFWGNGGKCEPTGSPRFDALAPRPKQARPEFAPKRILVTTARTAGFTPDQIRSVRDGLRDMAEHLDQVDASFETVWRVSPEVEDAIPAANTWGSAALWDQLHEADVLVTTPSTVQLEGMKAGLPVILLDYGNRPAFVPAAWTITARAHITDALRDACRPSPQRLSHQEMILDDNLECRTPATPRVVKLAETMIAAGRASRAEDRDLSLPARILPSPAAPERSRPLADLHPDHVVFSQSDVDALQAETGHLREAMRLSWTQAVYRAICRLEVRWSVRTKREKK